MEKLGAIVVFLIPLSAFEVLSQKVTVSEERFESRSLLLSQIFGPDSFPFDDVTTIQITNDADGNDVLRFSVRNEILDQDVRVNTLVDAVLPEVRKRAKDRKIPIAGI